MPVYFDCTDKEAFSDLRKKYAVGGFPCVVFTDPEGKKLKEVVGAKDVGEFTSALDSVAKKYPGRPTFWHNTTKSAAATKKKVAVYVAKEGADPIKITMALNKNLGDRKTKLAWTWERGTAKVLETRGLESAPGVVIYDLGEKDELKLLGRVTIKEGDDLKLLNQGIDDILKSAK
ncbi:MAG TPA: hypothetical protein VFS19_06575 [Planctomycetota bacterium]|nr:hypothetical protein [Planctomycetota bacterium]